MGGSIVCAPFTYSLESFVFGRGRFGRVGRGEELFTFRGRWFANVMGGVTDNEFVQLMMQK